MILRLFRGTVGSEMRPRLRAYVRDRLYPVAAADRGLRALGAGIADRPGNRTELLVVSAWAAADALPAPGVAGNPSADTGHDAGPLPGAPAEGWILPERTEHYELVGTASWILPLSDVVIRVEEGELSPFFGPSYFDVAREREAEHEASPVVLASCTGRRLDGDRVRVVHLSAMRRVGIGPVGPEHPWVDQVRPAFVTWSYETFDAPLAELRGDEPALVIADRAGRIVFASPPAGHRLQVSPTRLVGRHLRDVGLQTDAAAVATGRGPWPGYHTIVLDGRRPADLGELLDAVGLPMPGAGTPRRDTRIGAPAG